jgi:hypothetical protein
VRLNWKAVGALIAASAAVAVVAAGISCISDLPPDRPPPAAVPGCGDGYIDLAQGEQCDPGDAGSSGCTSTCRVLCPRGLVWPNNNHCYQLAATSQRSLTPEGASLLCTDLGGHVVTFASEDEFQRVANHFQAVDAGLFWVGLQISGNAYLSLGAYEPGWGTKCSGCYAYTVDASQGLPRSDASAPTTGQGCVAASTAIQVTSWMTYPCNAPPTHVICEREPSGVQSKECDAGVCIDLVATHGAKRYAYQAAPVKADVAETMCHGLDGGLVVLQSRDEREQLWHELSKLQPPPLRVWIGLHLVDGGATDGGAAWVWDNGVVANDADAYPSPWGNAQPVADGPTPRAYLSSAAPFTSPTFDDTLAHNDDRTVTTLPYVCELPP